MKSEPKAYSIDDLEADGKTMWEGVRNFQARNFMMNDMSTGDLVLFYHSNAEPSGIVGIAEVCSSSYADPTQFDRDSKYFDLKAEEKNPRWFLVDIKFKKEFKNIISLEQLKGDPALKNMKLVQKGQRLSVQPVSKKEFEYIIKNF